MKSTTKSTSIVNTLAVITLAFFAIIFITASIVGIKNLAWGYHTPLSPQERFNSGYERGQIDCGHPYTIVNYIHSEEYYNHSPAYHDGYYSGANSCDGDPQYYPTHYSELFVNQPQQTKQTTNTVQNPTMANMPKISCVGDCKINVPTSQIQKTSSGAENTDTTNSGNGNDNSMMPQYQSYFPSNPDPDQD